MISHRRVVKAESPWSLVDFTELLAHKDLLRFLIWRQIKVRYSQSVIGIGWAVVQPLFSMIMFTIVFGRLAGMESEGAPYELFSFVALVPWIYFSNSVTEGVGSLINEANMLSKVYFPRVLLPLSAVIAKLLDFSIAMLFLACMLAVYRTPLSLNLLALPILVTLMIAVSAGLSIGLAGLAVQYRDVKHGLAFAMQLAMYASPVVYPTSLIPIKYQWIYSLNPMVGIIEGFRSAFLGTQVIPWHFLGMSTLGAAAVLAWGLAAFRKRERTFADLA